MTLPRVEMATRILQLPGLLPLHRWSSSIITMTQPETQGTVSTPDNDIHMISETVVVFIDGSTVLAVVVAMDVLCVVASAKRVGQKKIYLVTDAGQSTLMMAWIVLLLA